MLYTFDELQHARTSQSPEIGKKAESLIALLQAGAPVPPGACLSTHALELFLKQPALQTKMKAFETGNLDPSALQAAIKETALPTELETQLTTYLAQYPGRHWAVRSSGIQEDLAEASFAGLYSTVLNVSSLEDLTNALRECWASLFGERVQVYAQRQNIPPEEMRLAVILQEMIPAEKSGVLFTVHPLTGKDTHMLIEAVPGLGEALVSGSVTPDSYTYDWYRNEIIDQQVQVQERCLFPLDQEPFVHWKALTESQGSEHVLTPAEIQALCQLSLNLQSECGFPIDLEWVQFEQKFYIVQRRPITRLHYQGIEGEWTTADFKDGGVSSGVCTPYMWSLYDYIWEQTMPSYLRKTHLLAPASEKALWGDMFFARPYWNVGAVKAGLKNLPGFVERDFDEDIGIEITYEDQGHTTPTNLKTVGHGLRVLNALKKSFAHRQKYNQLLLPRIQKRLSALDAIDPAALNQERLYAHYEQIILEDYFQIEGAYFYHIFDNSNVTTLFKDQFKTYKDKIKYLPLISGLTDLSHLRQNFALWDLSRQIRSNAEALQYWISSPIDTLRSDWANQITQPMMPDVSKYIQNFRYHSTRELDITIPRYGEDPSFVFESLKSLLSLDDSHQPQKINQKQHQEYQREREKLLKSALFFKRKSLGQALDQLRSFLWWREELRDLSTRMYDQIRRVTLAIADELIQQNILAAQDDIFFLRMPDILRLIRGQLLPEIAQAMIRRNRQYYHSFRNFRNPNEIGSDYTGLQHTSQSGNELKGIPCSPGLITGIARVIEDINDAQRLQSGDILITRFTDPGWTPKFGLLAGVATETGGLLSHAAVIAREYGIPAVLAIPGLTQRILDGQTVTIDGNQGLLILSLPTDPPES